LRDGGANVAVVSRHATQVFVSIFDDPGETELHRLRLPHRLGDVHFGFVAGFTAGTRYGLRADGPWDPAQGHRFDLTKLLIDPYATRLDRPFRHEAALIQYGVETSHLVPKCIAEAATDDASPLPPARPGLIYEVPVKAFTRLHPGVPEAKRGTVAALAEPVVVEHLLKLGVDTVELMPLAAWIDERHLPPLGLGNAWGYNPICFMAPDPRLAPGGLPEIRTAVDALHRAGIRVLLDAVFNHTGESDQFGATLSLRGLDNALYYRHRGGELANDSGCGNTLALGRPAAVQLVMDAMRGWIARTGIDGFRFDLAPVLGRRESGFDSEAPLLAAIEQDPVLAQRVMVAEPWDVGEGGYRLGGFPPRWLEWNDRYRDDVRRFWNGTGNIGDFATRIAGSSDVFAPLRRPSSSVNYVASHDGFTLSDTVTHADRNNHANGEGNRDGNGHEPVWPGGDARSLLATLFLSRGTPMLTAGDEFGRSQGGNNNAYAQDNAVTWLDWKTADKELIDFTARLVELRKAYPVLAADRFLSGAVDPLTGFPDAQWLKPDGSTMDWQDAAGPVLGLLLAAERQRICLWFNRGKAAVSPQMPRRDGYRWSRVFGSAPSEDLPPASVALYAEESIAATGISDDLLDRLADAAGIERDWWEVDGTYHRVQPENLRVLLAALRIHHATPAEAETSLQQLRQRRSPLLAPVNEAVPLGPATSHRRRLSITGDDGTQREIDAGPGDIPRLRLPAGIYDVRDADDPAFRQPVIVTPGACFMPDDLASGNRVFGLAAHLYALRHQGGSGIGDLETLKRFAELSAAMGGRYAGLNPLHHLFPRDRTRVSPYQPSDRRFIDPIYIAIDRLLDKFPSPRAAAIARQSRAAFARLEALPLVDYAAVWQAKSAILEAAFAEFSGNPDFDAFVEKGGEDLRRHGHFEATAAGEPPDRQRIAYRAFLQWIASLQLGEAATAGNLYRDLALGCAFDGGEIAEAPEIFAHGVSIGAPPDPFARTGQVWNLPPFSPLALANRAYRPMQRILAANMEHAAALRIDHILGFARQFWVPAGAEGRSGAYVRFPAEALIAIAAIESHRHRCLVIGEDLGTVPEGLREQLAAANIFSYRVLWFERDGLNFAPPSHYPRKALACLASHDLPTFKGWQVGRDIAIEQELGLLDGAEVKTRLAARQEEVTLLARAMNLAAASAEEQAAAAHGYVASSPAQVMLIQADDLAGETDPLNVPGTDKERPNWRRRLRVNVEQIANSVLAKAIIARVRKERPQ